MLVYYEQYDTAAAAIQREKNIKHWSREWKIDLILSFESAMAGFVPRRHPITWCHRYNEHHRWA
jgi:predicted GIY-YIG superfamily endonuclease